MVIFPLMLHQSYPVSGSPASDLYHNLFFSWDAISDLCLLIFRTKRKKEMGWIGVDNRAENMNQFTHVLLCEF
jgi:hypothetical protein